MAELIQESDIDTIIKHFANKLTNYPPLDQQKIIEAAQWANDMHKGQKRASGEPYIIHPIEVASILVDIRLDPEGVIAGLLHDVVEDTVISKQDIRRKFGKEIESLVNGVTKIDIVNAHSKSVQEAETIRKMLFAMTKDIRVILIKLADKRHNMSTLEFLPEYKRKNIAQECLDVYAPLAGRLGISWIKSELEDLALKTLHPEVYYQIKHFVAEKRNFRADYLKKVEHALYREAEKEGLVIQVQTRAKHFYSIYKKMKKKGKDLNEIYDMLGIRIICRSQNECYSILGLVHHLWKPFEGRFKDYIAMPKANRYQSLHTTVLCYNGRPTEIQIRTMQMHQIAEYGVAAHWVYKSGEENTVKAEDLAIVNKLKSWNGKKIATGDFLENIKNDLLKDSIYVFTPSGDIVELPQGSTAIDFAYHIHTDIGDHCFAAKADGVIIPLTTPLKNTQRIDIITSQSARPHLSWLRVVHSSRARSKIKQWLNKHDEELIISKSIVARNTPKHLVEPQNPPEKAKEDQIHDDDTKTYIDKEKVGIKIGNERNIMIRLARCCSPTTGDDIIGYVSRGRGIIVHKQNCSNLSAIPDFKERKVQVEWESVSPQRTYNYIIRTNKNQGIFSEIEGAIKKYRGHIVSGSLQEEGTSTYRGVFTIEMEKKEDSKKIMKSIRTIPSVMNITKADELPSMGKD